MKILVLGGTRFLDAADIARFAERALMHGLFGTYNTVGPRDTTTMNEVLEACARVAAERNAPPGCAVWVDGQFLDRNRVREWIEMPLCLNDPQYAGLLQVSNAVAIRAGFEYRPLVETLHSILDWAAESPDHRRRLVCRTRGRPVRRREHLVAQPTDDGANLARRDKRHLSR